MGLTLSEVATNSIEISENLKFYKKSPTLKERRAKGKKREMHFKECETHRILEMSIQYLRLPRKILKHASLVATLLNFVLMQPRLSCMRSNFG